MARAYRASCDTCGATATCSTRVEARQALNGHLCQHRCAFCCRLFPLLVDDGALCIECDVLLFPPSPLGRIA